MSKRLEVPADLEHLIEKRDDDENDRRGQGRRSSGRGKSVGETADKPERRQKSDRRGKRRRKSDS